jgi:hypothetical protein
MATLPEKDKHFGPAMRKIWKSYRNKISRYVEPGTSFSLPYVMGCDRYTLKLYLESEFEPGMGWENYGEWWMVNIRDHRKMDLTNEKDFLDYFNYQSYKPIWKKETCSPWLMSNGGKPKLKKNQNN